MKKTLLLIGALCALLAISVRAAEAMKVELTRFQALELFAVLSRIEPGLSPANTMAAADNINVLRATAESTQKGAQKLQREQRQLPAGAERDARALKLADEFEAKAEETIVVDLVPLTFSAEEIKEAKISAALLALIKARINPSPAKK